MLRCRFYIVPVSTITHQIITFQRNCHSECIRRNHSFKKKDYEFRYSYRLISQPRVFELVSIWEILWPRERECEDSVPSNRHKCGHRTACSRVSLLRIRCVCQSPCDVRRHQNSVNGTPVACRWVKSGIRVILQKLD